MADLQKLERDAFRRFYGDGLFDIYIGAMALVFFAAATMWELFEDELVSYAGMLAIGLIVTVPLLAYRRRLLRERLGTFQPGPRRKVRITRTRWVLLASVILGVVVFGMTALVYAGPAPEAVVTLLVPLLWFVNAVVVFGAMAYFLDVPRFYAYGFVLGLAMPLLIWPDALWGWQPAAWLVFGAAGIAIIAVGIYKLRHFLHVYPAPQHD
ncbi:MAG: hypothetical protein AB1Z67_01955 [Candidatus Limnocylindrales bacterium]